MVKARKILLVMILAFLLLPWAPVQAKKRCTKECVLTANETKSLFLPACVYFEGNKGDGGLKIDEKTGANVKDNNGEDIAMTIEQCCGCRDVNTFLQLAVNVVDWLFKIVGAVALVVFIYGGFMMLTSAGSDEKVKKGRDALVAAVIGLAIMFSAHLLIRFVLEGVLTNSAGRISPRLDTSGGLNVNISIPE